MYENERTQAAHEYISNGKSMDRIAEEMQIAKSTVRRWAKEDGGKEKRQKKNRRTLNRATTAAVKRDGRKLDTLITAGNRLERTLNEAAGLAEKAIKDIKKAKDPEKIQNVLEGFTFRNLQSLAEAVGTQTKTAFMLHGLMTEAEKRRHELDKKKLELEEKKLEEANADGGGDIEVVIAPELRAMLEDKGR